MTTTTRRIGATAGAALATALLAACSVAGPPAPSPPVAAPAPPDVTTPGSADRPDGAAVATLEIDTTNAEDEAVTVRFDVDSLDRDGDTVRLAMRLTNVAGDADYTPLADLAAGAIGDFTLSGVSLIDLTNDLRYLVLADTEGGCLCSDVASVRLTPGSGVDLQASFPAPAATVDEVDLQLGGLGTVVAVPIA